MPDKNRSSRLIDNTRIECFHDRVAEIVRLCGTVTAVAKAAGVSESVVRKWRDGLSEPSTSHLVALARAGNVSIEWLATGDATLSRQTLPDDEYSIVPRYQSNESTTSHHHESPVTDTAVIDAVAFKHHWIRQTLHANPSDLYCIYINDDSMAPTLRSGDITLIDSQNTIHGLHDGIYALQMDDCLLIKRIQRIPGGKIKVISDNAAYESFEFNLEAPSKDLTVIGRVIWSGCRV